MYCVHLHGKHRQLFAKEVTLILAKAKADYEMRRYPYNYAEIYNQEAKKRIRKNGLGGIWRDCQEE